MDLYEYEKRLAENNGFLCVCGADEAGRGPLAGPVYAAAVSLGDVKIEGLNDSKKLTPLRREKLYSEILSKVEYTVASASVGEIDKYNVLEASQLAMRRAVDALSSKSHIDAVFVDGNIARGFTIPAVCVVNGDALCASIAAASIIAKVTRDREMVRLDEIYPGYGFAKHKGYPTKQHYEALGKLGPSPVHRVSFLRKFYERQGKQGSQHTLSSMQEIEGNKKLYLSSSRARGKLGEGVAVRHLEDRGYKLVERNFCSHVGEIDLILQKDEYVVFTEVKLRKNRSFAEAAESVDSRKIHKIRRTAEYWLMTHKTALQPRFDVVEIYDGGGLNEATEDSSGCEINHIINAF